MHIRHMIRTRQPSAAGYLMSLTGEPVGMELVPFGGAQEQTNRAESSNSAPQGTSSLPYAASSSSHLPIIAQVTPYTPLNRKVDLWENQEL